MLHDVQTVVCEHLFRDCLDTAAFSDRTADTVGPGGHIAVVHTVGVAVQMLGLVCKGWRSALHASIDDQASARIPAFLFESVVDGLELCHCDQYPEPWKLASGECPDAECLHSMQVGGDFVASVAFVRKRDANGRNVLTVQYACPSRADGPAGVNVSEARVVQIPDACWVPGSLACEGLCDECVDWFDEQSAVLVPWLGEQRERCA